MAHHVLEVGGRRVGRQMREAVDHVDVVFRVEANGGVFVAGRHRAERRVRADVKSAADCSVRP